MLSLLIEIQVDEHWIILIITLVINRLRPTMVAPRPIKSATVALNAHISLQRTIILLQRMLRVSLNSANRSHCLECLHSRRLIAAVTRQDVDDLRVFWWRAGLVV